MAKRQKPKRVPSLPALTPFRYTPIPNTPQRCGLNLYRECHVLFLVGPPGTGKTHLAIGAALDDFFNTGNGRDRILLTRSATYAGGDEHGFLSGKLDEKLMPWFGPIVDVLRSSTSMTLETLLARQIFEMVPLGLLRGRTIDNATLIVDEAQNLTKDQFRMVLTRLGHGGKIIFCGDPGQSDLGRKSALGRVADGMLDCPGVGHVYFGKEDCVRNPLIGVMTDYLDKC